MDITEVVGIYNRIKPNKKGSLQDAKRMLEAIRTISKNKKLMEAVSKVDKIKIMEEQNEN